MVEKKTEKKKVESGAVSKPATTTIKEGEPEAIIPLAETPTPESTPERIRMRMSLANAQEFQMGRSYRVPEDVPTKTAESWLKSGVAEEDKSLDRPPETK